MNEVEAIQRRLFSLQDTAYRAFQIKLLPTVSPESVIGVRTPVLRRLAKELLAAPDGEKGARAFLEELPHAYFDENQLHAFILSEEKDFDSCLAHIEAFLPHIDNWATCDQLLPKVFKRKGQRFLLLPHIERWIGDSHPYSQRFAMGLLMQFFLDEAFDSRYLEMVAGVKSDAYYVRMMQAWYFATALAKQYEASLPYIIEDRLEAWTRRKAIQKALESRRISQEQKAFLKGLKNTR